MGEADGQVGANEALAFASKRTSNEDRLEAIIDAAKLEISTKGFDAFADGRFGIFFDHELIGAAAAALVGLNIGFNNLARNWQVDFAF